jgi:hypothetical protein
MSEEKPARPFFGILAEFETPEALVEAAEKAYADGYRRMDGYSPISVDGLDEALGIKGNRVPFFVLCGGIIGGTSGFAMQEIANVFHYPLIIGGKPYNSWPAFIPITFELTILIAAFFAVGSMIILNGLPELYHPLFNVPEFERASVESFFLCIESEDPKFDFNQTRQFLQGLGPVGVHEVLP